MNPSANPPAPRECLVDPCAVTAVLPLSIVSRGERANAPGLGAPTRLQPPYRPGSIRWRGDIPARRGVDKSNLARETTMAKPIRPEFRQAAVALGLVALGLALFLMAFRLTWASWAHLLAGWLLAINVVTFAFYGHDKRQARVQGRRVAEVVLHGLTLLGGSLGAYLGMVTFRHKTVKASFRVIFWLIAVLQVLLVLAVAYRLWTHPQA